MHLHLSCFLILISRPLVQKIDKLKAQLTAIADLIHPSLLDQTAAGELDEDELEILRAAGIVSSARSKGKGKPRHIVFVEDDAAGS